MRNLFLCVFSYPVGQRQEADKGCHGCHHFHEKPDPIQRCFMYLHTQQALLQRLWLWNAMKTSLRRKTCVDMEQSWLFSHGQKTDFNKERLTASLHFIRALYIFSCKKKKNYKSQLVKVGTKSHILLLKRISCLATFFTSVDSGFIGCRTKWILSKQPLTRTGFVM